MTPPKITSQKYLLGCWNINQKQKDFSFTNDQKLNSLG